MLSTSDILLIIASLMAAILFSSTLLIGNTDNSLELYNKYKDCKVLEVNHYNGFFADNTNKLNCNGTIYNVSTSVYNDAMEVKSKK